MASPGLQVFCSALLSLYSLRSFFLFVSLRFALLSSMVCVAPCSVCSPPKLQDFKTLTLTLTDRCHQMPNDELNADTTGLRQPCRVDDSNSTVDRLHYTTVYLNKSFCIIIIVWLVVVLFLQLGAPSQMKNLAIDIQSCSLPSGPESLRPPPTFALHGSKKQPEKAALGKASPCIHQ